MSNMEHKQKLASTLSRREFLKYGVYSGLAAGVSGSLWMGGCGRKKLGVKVANVILISIDTLRADHLDCYGYGRHTSPALDKLASRSLLFEDVSTPSPWTLPAHASLLTGLYPSRNGVRTRRNSLPDDVMTLAKVLRQYAFLTVGIVNSHWLSRKNGLHQGFDDFIYVEETVNRAEPTEVEYKAYEWLSKHKGEPFFLFLHYYDVHSDYRSLPHYEKQFVRHYSGIADGSTTQLLDFRYGRLSPNQADIEHLIDLYDASIRQMDDGIARLFQFLEKKGLFDNTLIIVTSDHGEEFLEHGGVLHGRTQFQEVIRVPLIVHGSGLPQGRRIKEIASLVDVMPTILALLEIPKPASLDGTDLCPLWQKSDPEPSQRFIFAEADWNNVINNNTVDDIKRTIRHRRYKLHYDCLTKKMQLYDLLLDAQEKIDVASEHTLMVDSLFRLLENFMRIENVGPTLPPLSPREVEKLKSLGYLQ